MERIRAKEFPTLEAFWRDAIGVSERGRMAGAGRGYQTIKPSSRTRVNGDGKPGADARYLHKLPDVTIESLDDFLIDTDQLDPFTINRKTDLDALVRKIEKGEELKPHLSTRVETVLKASGKKLARRHDLDLLLIEWAVHHLHISQDVQPNGFVKRDDPLLFAVFHPSDAYLIDVMTHTDFNRDHVLDVMAREWPDEGLIHELKAPPGQKIIGLAKNCTEDDRQKLRKAGVNTSVEIDGKVFKPAGGITTAGTSIRASLAADEVLRSTEKLEAALRNDPGPVPAACAAAVRSDMAEKSNVRIWFA